MSFDPFASVKDNVDEEIAETIPIAEKFFAWVDTFGGLIKSSA